MMVMLPILSVQAELKMLLREWLWGATEVHFAGVQDTSVFATNLFMSLCRALAASAPIWQFGDLVPCGAFFSIVTKDFKRSGTGCAESIRNSWSAIDRLSSTGETSPIPFQRVVMLRIAL